MANHFVLVKDGFYDGNASVTLRESRKEIFRLQTFKGYPADACKRPVLLAKGGFYYIGSGQNSDDTVICFSCRKKKRAWGEDEDIGDTHKNLCSTCAMVTGQWCGNIPIVAANNSFKGILSAIQAVRFRNCIQLSTAPENPTCQELGIITEKPKRQEYAHRLSRLQTFDGWPNDHPAKKKDLADAGFYFAGHIKKDCVECFHCGGALSNWEPDEDVWVEHARHFPTCGFIQQKLGLQFIQTVQLLVKQIIGPISFQMVTDKMEVNTSIFQIDSRRPSSLATNPAVRAVCSFGYQEQDNGCVAASQTEAETAALEKTNRDLRQKTACRLCKEKEVAVVFLPCRHLVCCTECSPIMQECPVCRTVIEGRIRAFMEVAC